MDEVPSQVVNFVSEKKCPTDINLQSNVLSQTKVKETDFFLDFVSSKTPSNGGESANSGFSSSISHSSTSSAITAKARSWIETDRCFSRTDKVWTNRGLLVDRKSLCSDASRDAFNMRNLRDALPSTSNRFSTSHTARWRMLARENRTANRSSKEASSEKDLLEKNSDYLSRFKNSSGGSCLVKLDKENVSDMSKKEQRNVYVEETFLDGAGQETFRQPNFCPEFAKMSLDDEQEESTMKELNSDVENNQQSSELPPHPKLLQDAELSFSNSERNQTADYQFPEVPPPANSHSKEEINADQSMSFEVAFKRMKRCLALQLEKRNRRQDSGAGNNQQSGMVNYLPFVMLNQLESHMHCTRNLLKKCNTLKVQLNSLRAKDPVYNKKLLITKKIQQSKSALWDLETQYKKLDPGRGASTAVKRKLKYLEKCYLDELKNFEFYEESLKRILESCPLKK